jgi:hypothetical protein
MTGMMAENKKKGKMRSKVIHQKLYHTGGTIKNRRKVVASEKRWKRGLIFTLELIARVWFSDLNLATVWLGLLWVFQTGRRSPPGPVDWRERGCKNRIAPHQAE